MITLSMKVKSRRFGPIVHPNVRVAGTRRVEEKRDGREHPEAEMKNLDQDLMIDANRRQDFDGKIGRRKDPNRRWKLP